jgi:hypothetical protein
VWPNLQIWEIWLWSHFVVLLKFNKPTSEARAKYELLFNKPLRNVLSGRWNFWSVKFFGVWSMNYRVCLDADRTGRKRTKNLESWFTAFGKIHPSPSSWGCPAFILMTFDRVTTGQVLFIFIKNDYAMAFAGMAFVNLIF